MRSACLGPGIIGLLLVCGPAAHAADSARSSPATAPAASKAPADATISAPQGIKDSAQLGDEELADLRGEGETVVIASQNLNSVVANPAIGGDVSAGGVSLSDNALSSFNGLGNVVINTGSQVSIQSGMNVIINVNQ
jgi:hypothetical protein